MMRASRTVRALRAFVSAASSAPVLLAAQSASNEPEGVFVQDKWSHDDNLFRLPEALQRLGPPAGARSTTDDVNRLSIGVREKMDLSRQTFELDLRADDVRFARNEQLDYVGGVGGLEWRGRLFGAWSGALDAQYSRSLADFSTTRTIARDLLERASYGAELRYELGPRWSVLGGGRRTQTEHSAPTRRLDDFVANSARAAIERRTPAGHLLALEYRRTAAEFPERPPDDVSVYRREYDEDAAYARLTYVASIRTRIDASYGRVSREYADAGDGEFSGNVWRAAIAWAPRTKFQMQLAAWRELRAYVDAESDYFISKGVSLGPVWSPLSSLTLSLAAAHEEQRYIGSDPLLAGAPPRVDEATFAQAQIIYRPLQRLRLELAYRSEERTSNEDWFDYDAAIASAAVRFTF